LSGDLASQVLDLPMVTINNDILLEFLVPSSILHPRQNNVALYQMQLNNSHTNSKFDRIFGLILIYMD
jgi:hypothetical protein